MLLTYRLHNAEEGVQVLQIFFPFGNAKDFN